MIFCMRKLKIKGEVYEKVFAATLALTLLASGTLVPASVAAAPEADSAVVAQENRL